MGIWNLISETLTLFQRKFKENEIGIKGIIFEMVKMFVSKFRTWKKGKNTKRKKRHETNYLINETTW